MYMTKAYKLTGSSKVKGICDYVSYLVQNDCKFIIFAHHLEVLDAIENTVTKERVKYIRIDGSTTQDRRHRGVENFQTMKDCKVAILSILAAG